MIVKNPSLPLSPKKSPRRRSLAVETLESRLNLSTLGGLAPLALELHFGRHVNTSQPTSPSKIRPISVGLKPTAAATAATVPTIDTTSLFGDTTVSTSANTTIPVTDYAAISNARIEYRDGTNSPDIGYMATSGVTIDYKVNAPAAGSYKLSFNVASTNWGSFDLGVNGSTAAQYSFNSTGGWSNYANTTQTINLAAGSNTIRVTPTWGSQFNINAITLTPTNPVATSVITPAAATATATASGNVISVNPTATISPDQYTDISNSKLEYTYGVPDIGYVSTSGAYVEYTLNVQSTANYKITVNAAATGNAAFDVLVNGTPTTTVNVPFTGSWSNFQPVSASAYLPAGTVKLRFVAKGGTQYNIGSISIAPISGTTVLTPAPAPAPVTAPAQPVVNPSPAGSVAIASTWMTSFNQLNVTGSTGNDSIYVSQSGDTLTINADGSVSTYSASSFGDLVIKGGDGNDTITVDSSVRIDALIYGQGGNNILTDATQGHGTIVAIGGGWDTLTGNGSNTSFWADTTDQVNASSAEWNGHVHQVSGFWGGVSTQLQGQNLADPYGTGATTRITNAALWGTGPTMSDVVQGQVSDCYLVAPLQTMAYAEPNKLRELAVDLGDGTYAVEFQRGGVATYVRVDGDLPANGPYANGLMYAHQGPSGNLWMPIIEKAYAEFRTGAWDYGSLPWGNFNVVLNDFGQSVSTVAGSDPTSMYNSIQAALAAGKGVTIGTFSTVNAGAPLIGSHSYTVTAASNGNLTLRNPWGFDGAGNDSNQGDALVTLSMAQLQANMQMGSILT